MFFNETYWCLGSIIYISPNVFQYLSCFTFLNKRALGYSTSHCLPCEYLIVTLMSHAGVSKLDKVKLLNENLESTFNTNCDN